MSHIHEKKAALRRELRAMSRSMDAAAKAAADAAIRAHILNSPHYATANTAFAYLGIDWEIDTRPLLEQILSDGKALCLPLCIGEREIALCRVHSLDTLLDGKYGIPEPPADAQRLSPEDVDLALIPCVGADRMGRRLGQGGGYYDTFLANYQGEILLLCREAAIVSEIPVESHDFPLPILVTENGIFHC